jgi:hypothetical protein
LFSPKVNAVMPPAAILGAVLSAKACKIILAIDVLDGA